jgi:hypothetical protein
MRKAIFSGVIGGFIILTFAFSIVYLMSDLFPGLVSEGTTSLINLAPALIAPIAGGFLAGLLAKENAELAGWIAGGLAGMVVLVGWVILMGFSISTFLRGLILGIVIAFVARVFSGLARPRAEG